MLESFRWEVYDEEGTGIVLAIKKIIIKYITMSVLKVLIRIH
jgi:hypothetical protein